MDFFSPRTTKYPQWARPREEAGVTMASRVHGACSLACQTHHQRSMSAPENRLGHAVLTWHRFRCSRPLIPADPSHWLFSQESLLGELKGVPFPSLPQGIILSIWKGKKHPSAVLERKYLFSSYVTPQYFRAFWVTETSACVYLSQSLG